MKHTVVFRGSQPVANVQHDDLQHDEKVKRAVDAAHRQNDAEGSSAEVKTMVQTDAKDHSEVTLESASNGKKGK